MTWIITCEHDTEQQAADHAAEIVRSGRAKCATYYESEVEG